MPEENILLHKKYLTLKSEKVPALSLLLRDPNWVCRDMAPNVCTSCSKTVPTYQKANWQAMDLSNQSPAIKVNKKVQH